MRSCLVLKERMHGIPSINDLMHFLARIVVMKKANFTTSTVGSMILSTREAHIRLPIRGGIVAVFPAELDRILIDSGILQ